MEQGVQRKNRDRQGLAEEIFDAGNGKVEGYTEAAAALQTQPNAATSSSMMRKQELLPRHHWVFFKVDRTEASKEPEPVPSSGMSETAACPPSPTADNTSTLPSPTFSPVGNLSCLFTRCQFLICQLCTTLLYFSRYCIVKIKNVLFFVFF